MEVPHGTEENHQNERSNPEGWTLAEQHLPKHPDWMFSKTICAWKQSRRLA